MPSRTNKGFLLLAPLVLGAGAYVLADLRFAPGPVTRWVQQWNKEWQVVARLGEINITRAEVELALRHLCFRVGADWTLLSDAEKERLSLEAVDEVIVRKLIRAARLKSATSTAVDADAVNAEYQDFKAEFDPPSEYARRLGLQQQTEGDLLRGIMADQQDEAWLSAQLETAAVVTDAEVRAYFEQHRVGDAVPERWRARHLFLSNHEKGKGDREVEIREIAGQIAAGKLKWPDVIAKRSDDERTKLRQGDLDWFSEGRMPAEFIAVVKTQVLGKVGEPVKTKLGWHLVDVLEKRPAREAKFEECAAEIRAKLEVEKREAALAALLKSLRDAASARIEMTEIPLDSILPQGYPLPTPPPTS